MHPYCQPNSSIWCSILLLNTVTDFFSSRVLIGVTNQSSPDDIVTVLNKTGVDLLLTDALRYTSALDVANTVDRLYSAYGQSRLAWNVGGRIAGHLASLVGLAKVKLIQLLLFTLPGTPVFNYGDEIGLQDEVRKLKIFIKRIQTDPGVFLEQILKCYLSI